MGIDIWFGPGGLKGVFGAGVALGLHDASRRGEMHLRGSSLRLFGSSVGCLNAVYLATGNAECGLPIYREDIAGLVKPQNLLPSVAARIVNCLSAGVGRSNLATPRNVLDVDQVFEVMRHRTPEIVEQIRAALLPVFAEVVDIGTCEFRHINLCTSPAPLCAIRHALNCFPFSVCGDDRLFDSGIKGYGFLKLLPQDTGRRLVVILNEPPRFGSRDRWGEIAAAVLSARRYVTRLYVRRRATRRAAIRAALRRAGDVMLISPHRPLRLNRQSDFERVHAEGRTLAQRIVQFIREPAHLS